MKPAMLLAVAVILQACAPAAMVNYQTQEQAIRTVNTEWMAAVAARDLDRVMSYHAPDAVVMVSNMPVASGFNAVRTMSAEMLKTPGLSLNWTATRIDVTSPTSATEVGTYRMGFDTPGGRLSDTGNYITTWRKIGGQWKVVADAVVSATPVPMGAGGDAVVFVDAPAMEMHAADGLTWREFRPNGFPAGAMMTVLHGDPAKAGDYALRVKFPDGFQIPVHWHTTGEHATVLSGTLLLAMGGSGDRSAERAHGPGSFLYMPARSPHYGSARGETVVQLHGNGPFKLTLGTP